DAFERVGEAGAERPPVTVVVVLAQQVVGIIVLAHRPSHVGDVGGDLVKRRVPVHLVPGRGEERVLLVRAGGGDVLGRHHPDADPLVAAGGAGKGRGAG